MPQPNLNQAYANSAVETLGRALQLRLPLLSLDGTSCLRLIDGEIPGVYLDRYGELAVLQRYVEVNTSDPQSIRSHLDQGTALAAALGPLLQARLGVRAIWLKLRPRQANTVVSALQAGLTPAAPVWGSWPAELPAMALENHLTLGLNLAQGLPTGLYLDQRDNRRWVRDNAKNRRFLNTFCYTAAFSVAAAAGGAVRSVSIDAAAPALAEARANLQRNGFIDPAQHDLIRGDALQWLKKFAVRGDRFDAAVLDPPSYSTVKGKRWLAERDYPVLVQATAAVLDPGAWLLACVNASAVSATQLKAWVQQGCDRAGKPLQSLEIRKPGLDHPEGRMKAVVARLRA